MIKHTYQDGQTVDLFCTRDVMEILKVASDETVRRRAKQCKVTGIKLRGVTAYTEADVTKMANYVKAVYKPKPFTSETPGELTVTAYEAALVVGIPTMSFVRRAFTLGIKSDDKKRFTVDQVRDYVARYDDYVAKKRAGPHDQGVTFAAGPGEDTPLVITKPDVVYERTTWQGAVYLKRPDIPPAPKEGIGYEVDRRQMRPCAML